MQDTKIYLIGIGMGGRDTLTLGAWKALNECDCLLGAQRMTDAFSDLSCPKFQFIAPAEMLSFLNRHSEYRRVGVVFSGDTGFYSGAGGLRALLREHGYEPEEYCGAGSVSYFFAKLHLSWEDARLVSAHGRSSNPVGEVRSHAKVFFLTGTPGVTELCQLLCKAGFGALEAAAGERLSYPEERIVKGTLEELSRMEFAPLSVLLVQNPTPLRASAGFGLSDDLFLRGGVPMTKSEVRCVSLSRLNVHPDDIAYDVGAGTGSVSVELARLAYRGAVYAVEKNPEALALARENQKKFGCGNLTLIEGTAPEALQSLPAPDCVFIGGSSGTMADLLSLLLKKNARVRVVINAITLETLSRALEAMEQLGMRDVEISQISVSRAKKAGSYHMMAAQNPVFVISARGGAQ